jgi:catalase
MNVSPELDKPVATGLGMPETPEPMPKVLHRDVKAEVTKSPALSLFARPGDGSIRARRIAVLAAEGADLSALESLVERLTSEGAVARLLGPRLGRLTTAAGESVAIDAPLDAAPSVLWDGVIVPDGRSSAALAADGRAVEFIKDQFRHCKPMLVIGSGQDLLTKAGVPTTLPDGGPDPGLILSSADLIDEDGFVAALAKHRHFARETDPPRV